MKDEQEQTKKKKVNGRLSLKVAKICAVISFTLFVILFIIVIFSNKQATQNVSQETVVRSNESEIDNQIQQLLASEKIKPSKIISSKDISFATRSRRYTYLFSSEVSNNDELLATAADAAMQIQKEMDVQYSSVVLFDSQNRETTYLAVDFAPDRKGASGEKDSGSRFNVTWYNKLPQ